jgi:hypothetical protein
MSKKTPVKKSKRRLKRSARRSLAAVLMITAIAVAAVPVPENYADNDAASAASADADVGYTPDATPASYDNLYDTVTGTAVYTLDIYDGGLYWQYMVDSANNTVIQYNAGYPSPSLSLVDHAPTNYTYVTKSEYDTYVDTTTYTLTTENYYNADQAKAREFFLKYFPSDAEDVKATADDITKSPVSKTRSVSELSDQDRRTYYCILHKTTMTDHILVPIRIEISNQYVLNQMKDTVASGSQVSYGNGDTIYIPKYNGTDAFNEYTHDSEGYLLFSGTLSYGSTQSIKHIGAYAFAGTGYLQTIDLPITLQTIGVGAFMNCYYLQKVNLPFLSEIPDYAFKGCSNLTVVDWWTQGTGGRSSNLTTIGKEAFYGTGVKENESGQGVLKFPTGVSQIDTAAFYGCGAVTIEFDAGQSATGDRVSFGDYAFFDNTALETVTFNNKNVTKFGDYCFAVGVSQNAMKKFTFPNSAFTGKKILANRTNLKEVTVPENVGNLQEGIFSGCTNLDWVKFEGVTTTYDPDLFDDVTTDSFYVTGYATTNKSDKKDNVENASEPRKATWEAEKTAAGNYIPYKFTLNGKDYYEICSGEGYLESIEIDKSGKGTLTSVSLKDENSLPIGGELVIPDKVGNVEVTKIASDCFTGKTKITGKVQSLVVGNYITEIDDSVFKSWSNLSEVEIGKSVQSIGKEAFADCEKLNDVTFLTPDSYETLASIGENAFATNSGKLTIHGDLVDGYAPFEYAVDPNNYVSSKALASGSESKYRILYQSRWDSPKSKHMSVIYGDYDDGNGYVTLVDYPLYKDFYDNNGDAALSTDLEEHNRNREKQFYNSFGNYSYPTEEDKYLEQKVRFAYAYDNAKDDAEKLKKLYADETLYGPWVNPSFSRNYTKWLDSEWTDMFTDYTVITQNDSSIFDFLFTPLTVEAADTAAPTPYFSYAGNEYNFMENYNAAGGDRGLITVEYKDGWTLDEEAMLKSYEEIEIPSGVESIDIKGYFEAKSTDATNIATNRANYILYFGEKSGNSRKGLFVYDLADSDTAGLFRAPLDDGYTTQVTDALGNPVDEGDYKTGNDRIKSVDMSQSSVKYIPDYAFEDCQLLETVSLPASCETTGALPFKGCGNLTTLTSTSENVPAQNGILYEKQDDGTYELVECILSKGVNGNGSGSVSKSSDDPYISAISSIDESAFEDCQGISTVNLSDSTNLKKIPDKCFKNCDNLTVVDLPTSTKEVGQEAFANIREDYYYADKPNTEARLNLYIRGTEFNVSESAFDPKKETDENTGETLSTIDLVNVWTYEDSAAERYALEMQDLGYDVRLGNDKDTNTYISKTKVVYFYDWNGQLIGSGSMYLGSDQDSIEETDVPTDIQAIVNETGHRPGYTFTGWSRSDGEKFNAKITWDYMNFFAQYESDGTMVNGKYEVVFMDGLDGSTLSGMGATKTGTRYVYYVDPLPADSTEKLNFTYLESSSDGAILAPEPKSHESEGYTFLQWMSNQETWTKDTEIKSNMTVIALYTPSSSSGGTGTSGSSTSSKTSGGSSSTSGKSSNSTSGSSTSSSSTSSSSTSTSSTTSGSDSTAGTYTVTVVNGSGSGTYATGSTVVIAANTPASGMKFSNWTTDSNGVTLASVSMSATTFVMPANNVTVTANYVADNSTSTSAVSTNSTGSTDNGGTRVDITKPGISNKDLATANVNGSTDNFVVKISETDEATQAVSAALTNKYGSLDNILYYAMDITLWDSTGTYQITDAQAQGLTVDITIPIPDALVAYGGNNMAGAVINDNQLESLNENFTTINGVPCIRFTATHFSPYTVYVDTGNLTEGMLDVTPKTGDPIHPKWFLSLGLACLSIILFMKKDKNVKVKTA